MTEPAPKNSDLPARVGSAVVMVLVAGTALWLGGWAWTGFVLVVAAGVLWEWVKLANMITPKFWARLLWLVGGVVYIGVAASTLIFLRLAFGLRPFGITLVLMVIGPVIATDIGAYFSGRAIGGPKIAPSISPSKTWAGLGGGAIAAALSILSAPAIVEWVTSRRTGLPSVRFVETHTVRMIVAGVLVAIVAQAGDFFESWMKRQARVKDSGRIIPGHGGLFDRADGVLAVLFLLGTILMLFDR